MCGLAHVCGEAVAPAHGLWYVLLCPENNVCNNCNNSGSSNNIQKNSSNDISTMSIVMITMTVMLAITLMMMLGKWRVGLVLSECYALGQSPQKEFRLMIFTFVYHSLSMVAH